ncbi:hypothetical protein FRC03_009221 [Tulasnella sp. 419]|nr:hypothetical protein FRC03_009221 [Tulasnella sp. 419]
MPQEPPGHLTLPPPAFPQGPPPGSGPHSHSQLDLNLNSPIESRRPRVSFGYPSIRRFSYSSSARRHVDDLEMADESSLLDTPPVYDLPPIPSALPKSDSTPLPLLPMVVLSIAMLGEFLSANVSTPFLLFMVEGFGVGDGDESKVGYLTGILVSMFFITQFITSILWAAVADKHGRRAVLFISLLGNALTCFAFGTATTFPQAVVIRLLQGIFNGSVGVARGAVSVITDPSNEARAYATIGFCWGLGGVAGAVIGGAFEHPAVTWPNIFGDIHLFVEYPYLLPCAIAASITFVGAVLSLFLGWDGGPREGLIRLEEKGEEEIAVGLGANGQQADNLTVSEPPQPETVVHQITSKTQQVTKKLSGYFARRVREAYRGGSSPGTPLGGTRPSTPQGHHPSPHHIPIPGKRVDRSMSRTSAPGSAYGYSAGMRHRLAAVSAGRGSPYSYGSGAAFLRRRRNTGQTAGTEGAEEGEDLNLAQRLLLATEGNVTNMANLWVQAAINADNEDPFYEDSEGEEEEDEDADDERNPRSTTPRGADGENENNDVFEDDESLAATSQPASRRSSRAPPSAPRAQYNPRSASQSQTRSSRRPSGTGGFGFQGLHMTPNRALHPAPASVTSRRPSASTFASSAPPPSHYSHPNHSQGRLTPHHPGTRRGSISDAGHAHVYLPSIYANTGLQAPPALALYDHLQLGQEIHEGEYSPMESPGMNGSHTHITSPLGKNVMQARADSPLSAIQESHRSSLLGSSEGGSTLVLVTPAEPSLWKQLPVMIVFQYGLLALHNVSFLHIYLGGH